MREGIDTVRQSKLQHHFDRSFELTYKKELLEARQVGFKK